MRSTRARATSTVLIGLIGGAMALGSAGAAAASGQVPVHKGGASHSTFVVGAAGKSELIENYGTPSALVRDANGGEHLVTTQPKKGDPTMGHLVYFIRTGDKADWKRRVVPGVIPLNGGVSIEAHLSTNSRQIVAVLYRCDGIYVTDAAIGSQRLAVPNQVVSLDECASPPAHSINPPIEFAAAGYENEISIVLPGSTAGSYVVDSFRATDPSVSTVSSPLPTTDGFTPVQITGQPDALQIVGTGTDGTNEGIYVVTGKTPNDDTWSQPTLVASMNSATTDYTVDALQTDYRHTYIGLEKPADDGQALNHRLYVVRGKRSGNWLGAIPLAHTDGDDHNLRLAINSNTGHLHAAWTRVKVSHKGKTGGLMHEQLTDNGWTKPVMLTNNYRDIATELTITNHGKPVIGYYTP